MLCHFCPWRMKFYYIYNIYSNKTDRSSKIDQFVILCISPRKSVESSRVIIKILTIFRQNSPFIFLVTKHMATLLYQALFDIVECFWHIEIARQSTDFQSGIDQFKVPHQKVILWIWRFYYAITPKLFFFFFNLATRWNSDWKEFNFDLCSQK